MRELEFLIGHIARDDQPESVVIGETGFSFRARKQSTRPLTSWTTGNGIPPHAREVLQGIPEFRNIVGLIGVPDVAVGTRHLTSEWVLASTAFGLTSIAVRDVSDCSTGTLTRDADLATAAAKRYGAESVVVLVQGNGNAQAETGRKALSTAFDVDLTEADRVQRVAYGDLWLWVASLSA
jgi:hypothetical protein